MKQKLLHLIFLNYLFFALSLLGDEGIKYDAEAIEKDKKTLEQGKAKTQPYLELFDLSRKQVKFNSNAASFLLIEAARKGSEKATKTLKERFSPFQELYWFCFSSDEIRNWKLDNFYKNANEYILELVPLNETVNNWSQMLTVMFASNSILNANSRKALTSLQTYKNFLSKEYGERFTMKIYQAIENDVIYEALIPYEKPGSEHEIVRIIRSYEGLHRISYSKRGSHMDEKTKEKWLKYILEATPIKYNSQP